MLVIMFIIIIKGWNYPDEIVLELPLPLNVVHELPWTSMTLKCNISLKALYNLIILATLFHKLPCPKDLGLFLY